MKRLKEMDLTVLQVIRAVNTPGCLDYPGSARHPKGRRVRVGGGIAAVYNEANGQIITVLWDGKEQRHG